LNQIQKLGKMKKLLRVATFLVALTFGDSDEIINKDAMLRKRKIATSNTQKIRKAEKHTFTLFTTQNETDHNPNDFLQEAPTLDTYTSLGFFMSVDYLALTQPLSTPSTSAIPTFMPTMSTSPSVAPAESLRPTNIGYCKDPELRDSLILARLMAVSSSVALQDMFSPQFEAYRWILRDDPLQLGACATSLIQRYILVLFHNQLNGNFWGKTADWLTGTSECMWANVVCQAQPDEDGDVYDVVTELNVGKCIYIAIPFFSCIWELCALLMPPLLCS
jgi:hypothetical protein